MSVELGLTFRRLFEPRKLLPPGSLHLATSLSLGREGAAPTRIRSASK
jgi:hypothetical protein